MMGKGDGNFNKNENLNNLNYKTDIQQYYNQIGIKNQIKSCLITINK